MLNQNDSTDYRNHPTGKYKQYLFKCPNCETDVWVRNSKLKKHTGWCFDCTLAARTLRPYESTHTAILSRSKIKGYSEAPITYEEFLEFVKIKQCVYCNEDVKWSEKRASSSTKREFAVNLDRLDSDKGYCTGNLVVCCPRCNYFKSSWVSYEAMKEIGPILSKHNTGAWYRGGHTGPVKT
jgi:hypothetical protein